MSVKITVLIILSIIGAALFGGFLGSIGHEPKIQNTVPSTQPISQNQNSAEKAFLLTQYSNATNPSSSKNSLSFQYSNATR